MEFKDPSPLDVMNMTKIGNFLRQHNWIVGLQVNHHATIALMNDLLRSVDQEMFKSFNGVREAIIRE
ncbi:MAG: hypothetical protein AAGC47_08525, partial [Bacteroidota bacterium]